MGSKKAIMKHTSVCVSLSINVIARRGQDTRLMTFPIFYLTTLIMALWILSQWANRTGYELSSLARDIYLAFDFTLKVWAIGLSAVAWAVGVRV